MWHVCKCFFKKICNLVSPPFFTLRSPVWILTESFSSPEVCPADLIVNTIEGGCSRQDVFGRIMHQYKLFFPHCDLCAKLKCSVALQDHPHSQFNITSQFFWMALLLDEWVWQTGWISVTICNGNSVSLGSIPNCKHLVVVMTVT